MNAREKVFIGLMVIAIGYALFHYLKPALSYGAEQQTPDQAREEATQFVTESRERIAGVTLGEVQEHAESRIAMAWSGNPFAKRFTSVVLATPVASPVKYSGYLNVDGQPFGLVDGAAYKPGDVLAHSPYRIRSITAEQLVLDTINGTNSLTVKLEEDPTRRREQR